MTTKIFTNN